MSFFKNRIIAVLAIVIVSVLLVGALLHFTGTDTSLGPVAKVTGVITKPFSAISDAFASKEELIAENEALRAENARLLAESRTGEEYIAENKRLSELLGLKEELSEYETVAARVIAYEAGNWFGSVTINRGSKDGITENCAVITAEGLVGRVTYVEEGSARIDTITSAGHSLGARLVRTGGVCVCEGDSVLGKSGMCRVEYVAANSYVMVGDVLETSGLGGVFPEGIAVGRISEVITDKSGSMQYAVVEPFADTSKLDRVLVITDYEYKPKPGAATTLPEPLPEVEAPDIEDTTDVVGGIG